MQRLRRGVTMLRVATSAPPHADRLRRTAQNMTITNQQAAGLTGNCQRDDELLDGNGAAFGASERAARMK